MVGALYSLRSRDCCLWIEIWLELGHVGRHVGVNGIVFAGAIRKARDNPYTTFDLIAIAAYDAITQDLGVCGNLVCVVVALLGFKWQYFWILLLLDILLI